MRVEDAHSVGDLRRMAYNRLPRAVFDFFDGGAEDENTLQRNRAAFGGVEFAPRVMVDVAERRIETSLLGDVASFPLIVAPTGMAAIGWPQADIALARAAGAFGVPFIVSTASSVRLEDVARAAPNTRLWFQLYVYRDREIARDLVRRAQDAGFEGIVLTVDCPVFGRRERELRHRFGVPITVTPRIVWDAIRCPRWTFDLVRHGMPRLQNFVDADKQLESVDALIAHVTRNMDASITWSDVAGLFDGWRGKMIIKGLLSPADVAPALAAGFDAIVVSNHGGRQFDHAPATLSVLPEMVATVAGRAEVYIDGGVRRGSDIAKSLCLGARAVMVGRATLFGVAAAGQPGAERALSLLRAEFDRTLALLGCPSAGALNQSYLCAQGPLAGALAG